MPTTATINGLQLTEPLYYEIHREPMLSDDGADYLVSAVYLQIVGTYNPSTNAFILAGGAVAPKQGTLPAKTYNDIRHKLEQNRGSVVLNDGNVDIFNIVGPDARNGPVIKVHDIQEVMGLSTYVISLSVAIYMNEAHLFDGESVILSHRYKAFDDFDEDTYLTRTIRGSAEFRSDYMALLSAVPDQFRAYLWHPTPPGMKLDLAHVEVDSNGLSMDYTMTFRQKPLIVVVPGVTRIEAFDSVTHSQGNFADHAIGIAQGAASLSLGSTIEASLAAAPHLSRRTHIRVWGYPTTGRVWLQHIAEVIASARWGGDATNVNAFTVVHDLMGRYVEIVWEKSLGGFSGTLLGAAIEQVRAGLAGQEPQGPVSEELEKIKNVFTPPGQLGQPGAAQWNDAAFMGGTVVDTIVTPSARGPFLPNDPLQQITPAQGCRGTYIGQLVMAALLGTDATPKQPNLPKLVTPQRSLRPAGAALTQA